MTMTQKIYNPKTLSELDALLDKSPAKIKFVAGATDLMVEGDAWKESETFTELQLSQME